jgi:hypothetical protein
VAGTRVNALNREKQGRAGSRMEKQGSEEKLRSTDIY